MDQKFVAPRWAGAWRKCVLTGAVWLALCACAEEDVPVTAGPQVARQPETPGASPASRPTSSSVTPASPSRDDATQLGCDAVHEFRAHEAHAPDAPFRVAPGQTSPTSTFDAPWGDARVQAIALKPLVDNPRVLHHFRFLAGDDLLLAWGPRAEDWVVLPRDVGIDLPKGPRSLRLLLHYYNSNASPVPDRSGVAVCVVRGDKLRAKSAGVTTKLASFGPVMAPPRVTAHPSTGKCRVRAKGPVTLLRVQPYAHRLVKSARSTLTRPDGTRVVLYDATRFLFGEQERAASMLDPPVVVQAGDVIETTCVYDNPAERSILFGESTDDELCFDFALYHPKGQLDCEALPAPGVDP